MSDEQVISIDPTFFKGLSSQQKQIFDKLIQQNNFLRESIATVEESATDRVATLNAELEDADNSIDKLEAQVATLRVELSRMQAQHDDLLEVVETATESAKLSMMREAQVTKDAEKMIKEKTDSLDARVNQAEFNLEQKYTSLLYEVQDEKDALERRLKDVEAELASTLVIVDTKTKRNTSLTQQVQQLEETKSELEEEISEMKKSGDPDTITALKAELAEVLEKNTELKEAVSRIKWRSKEEIDIANVEIEELKQNLASVESEQQQVSEELRRVIAERDSLEAEIENGRIAYKPRNSGDVSDLDSNSGSIEAAHSAHIDLSHPHLGSNSRPLTPVRKFSYSPRLRAGDRGSSSVDGDNNSQVHMTISIEEHKIKMAEAHNALEEAKKKHFLLMEEVESLRLQHTELIENNMLERKNREKLLKAAQKEKTTLGKQYKQCQKTAATVEKELADYLEYHKRQTEIKDSTIHVHKELAKSRAANADLAKQLLDAHATETELRQLNSDLETEVSMLLAEVDSLHNELDNNGGKSKSLGGGDSSSSDDSDSSDDDENDNAVFCNSFRGTPSPRPSTGSNGFNKKPLPRKSPIPKSPGKTPGKSSMSPAVYDTLKQMYLATALDSMDKQRKGGRGSSASSVASPSKPKGQQQPRMKPRQQSSNNLNDHYSPAN